MKVTVKITKSFKIAVKPLLKKYKSLTKDLLDLENQLQISPRLGTPLGKDTYKIRLKITSKGKGKSGGARLISLVESTLIGIAEKVSEDEIIVYLLTIYDKGVVENISDKDLKDLLQNYQLG